MEAFSLLKYWRAGGGSGGATATTTVPDSITTSKTIVAAAAADSPETSDGEDGPYIDLEFALPDQESDTDEQTSQENDVIREDVNETESEEEELNFSLTGNECTGQNQALSPSDDLFFKGDLVSIEEENSKFPIFLVKSATRFRVLLLKLKKSKSENSEMADQTSPKIVERESKGKMSGKFMVKFKVEEVPLVNLFTRDNGSKENHGKDRNQSVQDSDINDERKQVKHKYLKMVKPLYTGVSKLKLSGTKGGSVVRHLGKSRSASAAVKVVSDRRDDSLLQLQDGIQSAILHCKKSFNDPIPRDLESSSSSILCRSVSDPSYHKSIMMPKFSRVPSSNSGEAKIGIN